MSTRSERAERKSDPWNIACSYGAHQFVREEWTATAQRQPGLHAHHCTACGACYMATDPCWCTPGADNIGREKDAAAHQSDAGDAQHGQQQPPADPPD